MIRTQVTKRKWSKFLFLRIECESTKEKDRQEIMKAYKESLTKSSSMLKKPKTIRFDISKPDTTTKEDPEVIDDSPSIKSMKILEEISFPSSSLTKTPPSSLTKTPSSSLTKTTPFSLRKIHPPLPTKTPPPSLIKNPPPSSNKTPPSSLIKIPIVNNKPPPVTDSSSKSKNPEKKKYKLRDIVKPNYIPSPQLVKLSKPVNQESIRHIRQFSQ